MSLIVSGTFVKLDDTVQVLSKLNFSGTLQKVHLVADHQHLILSGSGVGAVVALSGVIKAAAYAQAGLPANAPSGSVAWVSDLKCFAGMDGNNTWVRILTGTL